VRWAAAAWHGVVFTKGEKVQRLKNENKKKKGKKKEKKKE